MAFQPLSVGDILMLSQTAWKIGRAFKNGKKSAPSEFAEVEREASGLSEALKLVAEALHEDGSILSAAEPKTRMAVSTILESAHTTLSDLESFVERYQVIKKKETNGGFMVERNWSDVVMANYKIFKWTTEGGDITDLRNMLQMHTNTIDLTIQALQSKSLARIEKTVGPMALSIADIHETVHGDLGEKIDDLHRFVMSMAATNSPILTTRDRAILDPSHSLRSNSVSTVSTLEQQPGTRPMLEAPPPRTSSYSLPMRHVEQRGSRGDDSSNKAAAAAAAVVGAARSAREDSAYYSMGPLPFERDGRRMDWGFEAGSPPNQRDSFGDRYDTESIGSPRSGSTSWSPSSSATPNTPATTLASTSTTTSQQRELTRRESSTLPSLFKHFEPINETDREVADYSEYSPRARDVSPSSIYSRTTNGRSVLPPPAILPDSPTAPQEPATPSTFFASPKRAPSTTNHDRTFSRPVTANSIRRSREEKSQSTGPPPDSAKATFEKSLFRNAAILCDVRATLVEFAQHVPDEPDPRYDTEMVAACKEARVCVIRKRENRDLGGTKVVTSIWALSDDGKTRIQQKLSEVNETVPYCSYFQPEKVSLPPTDGPVTSLRFHAEEWGAMLQQEKTTNWVNYVFVTENDATAFQSAIFGRMLIGSYRTTKTTVIHEGLKGAFAFEEQFANIEMLRLWEDDGVSTPGAAGGVLALMHISSNFGDGWARWWINSSKQQVRVRDDGTKHARVKGIDVSVVRPGSGASVADKIRSPATAGEGLQRVDTASLVNAPRPQGKRTLVKKVNGVRIEFKSEEERGKFVALAKRCQERMIALPDA